VRVGGLSASQLLLNTLNVIFRSEWDTFVEREREVQKQQREQGPVLAYLQSSRKEWGEIIVWVLANVAYTRVAS
jgi:hypothetical protein